MYRFVWIANGTLLALCCFFAAQTLNGLFAALLAPQPAAARTPAATAAPARPSDWNDREVILTRNLFESSLPTPPPPPPPPKKPPPPPPEEVEETELPLGLLGTISSSSPDRGWAALYNAETRRRLVVKAGDEVGNGRATVLRIERERLVLSENGAVRELVLDEDSKYRPPKRARRTKPKTDKGPKRGKRRVRRSRSGRR